MKLLPWLLLLPALALNGPACQSVAVADLPVLEFRLEGPQEDVDLVIQHENKELRLGPAHSYHVKKAFVSEDISGFPGVMFEIADEEQEAFFLWTDANTQKGLAVFHDGEFLTYAIIQTGLKRGGLISRGMPGFSEGEAEALAAKLNPH
ncbi:MAG: hypothetical protein DWQ01_12375 [Planctomycetota bacterium]|nr:MAG: hypothetical protein DWQ01_12375 [Planctomycetota bacterium]